MHRSDVPEAQPDDVAFRLSWRAESGHLTGELEATNVCDRAVRLSGKPGLTPIGIDGEALAAETTVTLELIPPGYVVLAPGERARAPVGWGGWDGPQASVRCWSRGRAARPRSRQMVLSSPRRTGRPPICGVLGLSASDDVAAAAAVCQGQSGP
jgi:hypothetical protein